MDLLSKALLGLFATIVTIVMIISALAPAVSPNVYMEARNYTVNYTYYPTVHTSNNDVVLYYFANKTYPIPASRYDYNTTHIRLNTNGTTPVVYFPNITANGVYYATYSYNNGVPLWGLDFGWLLLVISLAVVVAVGYAVVKHYL